MTQREQRRAAERERQQVDVLDVARSAFAESGFAGASMRDIATGSGHSVGHIYNLIGNKATLFDAVMLRDSGALQETINAAETSHPDDPAGAIDAIIDACLVFFDSHREFFEIYLRHAGGMRSNVERVFSPEVVEIDRKIEKQMTRLFRQAADAGLTAGLSPSDMRTALSELISGFIAAWATDGYRGRVSRKAKVIKHLLWNGISA